MARDPDPPGWRGRRGLLRTEPSTTEPRVRADRAGRSRALRRRALNRRRSRTAAARKPPLLATSPSKRHVDALVETEIEATALPVDGLVARLERRYEQTRLFGRDIDDLFKQLVDDLRAHWPEEPVERMELALRAFRIAAAWAERAKTPQKPVLIASELALTHIAVALPLTTPSDECVANLVDGWDESVVIDREAVEMILARASTRPHSSPSKRPPPARAPATPRGGRAAGDDAARRPHGGRRHDSASSSMRASSRTSTATTRRSTS